MCQLCVWKYLDYYSSCSGQWMRDPKTRLDAHFMDAMSHLTHFIFDAIRWEKLSWTLSMRSTFDSICSESNIVSLFIFCVMPVKATSTARDQHMDRTWTEKLSFESVHHKSIKRNAALSFFSGVFNLFIINLPLVRTSSCVFDYHVWAMKNRWSVINSPVDAIRSKRTQTRRQTHSHNQHQHAPFMAML